jgi:hypothetical protein
MRIEFTLTDNEGNAYKGMTELTLDTGEPSSENNPVRIPAEESANRAAELDFEKPLRPFVKAYAKGLSGPQKFILLLSWLSKGDPKNEVKLSDIQEQWEKMTEKSLLGIKFNRFFSAQARNNDWAESKKQGVYNLRPSWRNALISRV